ncbi:helicase associated domain-containing protein [Streptomyces sp. 2A115]|uniref:helicase associated domain-containing protein n=1 Tax=Streptomyces sp. 2A115 TaxID=3457439 RepID=UPI003FD021A1
MVWSHQDTAWEEGLSVARSYAAAHSHLLPPATAVWENYPIGTWCKNLRAAARKTLQNTEPRAAGEPVPSMPGSSRKAVWKRWRRSTRDGARPRGTSAGRAPSVLLWPMC